MAHKKNSWQLFGLDVAHSHPSLSTVYGHPEVYTTLRATMENDDSNTEGIQNTRSPLLEVPNEVRQR
jgi:hypothetical protein